MNSPPSEPVARRERRINLLRFSYRVFRCILILLAFACLVGFLFFRLPPYLQNVSPKSDYYIYYAALQELYAGNDFYSLSNQNVKGYYYLPPFLVLIYPLGLLDELSYVRAWYFLMFISHWVYAWCLMRISCQRMCWSNMLIAGFLLAIFPGQLDGFLLGNFQLVLNALWGIAFAFNVRPSALMLIAIVKFHAILPLCVTFFDEFTRNGSKSALRKVGFPAGLTLSVALFLGLIVCGAESYLQWLRYVPQSISQQATLFHYNASLSIEVLRLLRALGWWHYDAGPLTGGPRLFVSVVGLCGPLVVWWWARRLSSDLRQACVGTAVVLLAPLCWTFYLPIFLVPLALWWRETRLREWMTNLLHPSGKS